MGNTVGKSFVSKFWKTNQTTKGINLEPFLLVWLDPNVDASQENRATQIRLREILTCLVTFDDIQSCENWLKTSSSDEKIVLIVSGTYGEKLVPKIHYLPSIISIYVYCLDVNRNKRWSKDYPKVRNVISNTETLLKQLSMNQANLENLEDSKALQIYSFDAKTTSYIWYQLLLEILLSSEYLPSNSSSDTFLQNLQTYNSHDQYDSDLIFQFEQTYDPEHAVSWLVNSTSLARILNTAVREQNIYLMFMMRCLLVDIHQDIVRHRADSVDAYRLQLMTRLQMENLLTSAGQWLVMSGFLFASTNKSQLTSTMTSDNQYETVLVNIKAKYSNGVAPFAFLRDIDSNIEEQVDREIIFMCGSIFLIGPLVFEDSIWTLQLTLISDHDVPELLAMKQKLRNTHHLSMIGDLLNHCGQSEQAIIYYEQLLNELHKDHFLIPQIEKQLSAIPKSDSDKSQMTSSPPVACPRYIVINLSSHMTDFALTMLGALRSLTSDEILVRKNESSIDFSKWSDQSISIFTTAEFAKSLTDLPSSCKLFVLETDDSQSNEQNRCATIEDLISRLADEIIQTYRSDAYSCRKFDELSQATKLEAKADQIYRKILAIQTEFTTKTIPKKTSGRFEPSLICLVPSDKDIDTIENYFGDFFSSYRFFVNEHRCHEYIVERENIEEIFVIILTEYQSSITDNFRQFSNVKHVYSYGTMKNRSQRIFPIRNDLYYQLILDLTRYYAELADEYEINNERKIARDIFLKGQKLCQFLSEKFFS